MTTEQFLESESVAGLAARLAGTAPEAQPAGYRERLDLELKVICQMGFAGYFLIVPISSAGRARMACRWARGAARARAPWWRTASASRIWIPSNTICCSSAS